MRQIIGVVVAGVLAAAAGCGGGGSPVTGKVTNGEAPYTFGEGEGISITLTSEDGATSASGTAEKDGTFTIKSTTGGGVPAGKYKVSITHYAAAGGAQKGPPVPKTKTANEVWDVGGANKTFNLDMSKYK